MKDNDSISNGNQILPPPILTPSSDIESTYESISHEHDVNKTTGEKDLYQWEDSSEINPINEIVEFHTIDENENKYNSMKIDQDESTMNNSEANFDMETNNQLTTQSNNDSKFDLATTPGNLVWKLLSQHYILKSNVNNPTFIIIYVTTQFCL